MKIENGVLILETTNCHCARSRTPGQIVPIQHCCRKKKCGICKGEGYLRLPPVTCDTCNGTTIRPETLSDYAPQELVDAVPIQILRSDRGASWNESYLGLNCVYSCIDYGDASKQTDDQLLARVKSRHEGIQASHFVRLEDRKQVELVQAFGVYVNRQGYSVRPIFASTGVKTFSTIPGADIAIGHAVANAGGNGTLAAAVME